MVDVGDAGTGGDRDRWLSSRRKDRELVAGCRRGDEEAWTELWLRHGPLVKAIARRAGCDEEDAAEVLQRTALVALESLDRLREPEKLAGWLAGVARFQAYELRRSRRPVVEVEEHTVVGEATAETDLERDQQLALLQRALVELEPRCRRLVVRLELDDPPASYADVAAEEGLSPTSVGPIRGRCLGRLRKIVERLSRTGC